jgi:hypothetical protein
MHPVIGALSFEKRGQDRHLPMRLVIVPITHVSSIRVRRGVVVPHSTHIDPGVLLLLYESVVPCLGAIIKRLGVVDVALVVVGVLAVLEAFFGDHS